jgi:hypothetical protein
MIDLKDLMDERSAEPGAPGGLRLTEVRHRITAARRRRVVAGVAGAAGAAVMVAALVASVTLPGGAPAQPMMAGDGAATASPSAPTSAKPVAGRKIGPWDEYAEGYRVVASATAPVSAKKVQLTWTVSTLDTQFYSYCPGLPSRTISLDAEIAINGAPVGSLNCVTDLHQDPNGGRPPSGVSVGDTVTVTYKVFGAQDMKGGRQLPTIPRQGTIYFAVAEKVAFADFPMPSRPATLTAPHADGMATEPGGKVFTSDPADPMKPITTTMAWRYGYDYDFGVIPSTPGVYTVTINGVTVLEAEVYDYRGGGKAFSCDLLADGKFCVGGLPAFKDGETVTVTITPQYATGPWLVETRLHPHNPAARG